MVVIISYRKKFLVPPSVIHTRIISPPALNMIINVAIIQKHALLQLIVGRHMYNVRCNNNHLKKVLHCSLYLICTCPKRTHHVSMIMIINHICVIRLSLRIGCFFTHADYLRSKHKTTVNIIFSVTNSNCLAHYLIVNYGVVSPTLNVNLTVFVIPCKLFFGIIDLQYCNYCHILRDFFNPNFNYP
jgi:hypothetical protein